MAQRDPFGDAGFDVYTGKNLETGNSGLAPHYGHQTRTETQPTPERVDAGQHLRNYLRGLSKDQLASLQQNLLKAGYGGNGLQATGVVDFATVQAYSTLEQDASVNNESGTTWTPEQFLQNKLDGGKKHVGGNTGTTTSSSSTVSLTTGQEARTIALDRFTTMLGRRPSEHEMQAFYAALTAYEQTHPAVTDSTSTQSGTQADSNNTSSATQSGGVDPQSFADQYVEQNYGGEEGQHNSLHFYDLAMSTLTGPPSGVHAAT